MPQRVSSRSGSTTSSAPHYVDASEGFGMDFYNWYQQAVDELRGTEWESMIPGLNDQEFAPNWWQSFKENLFSDYQDRNNWYNQRQNQLREQITALLQEKRQQAYNDPSAQAARMSAAGINPNLTEGAVSGGEAASVEDHTADNAPDMNQGSEAEGLQTIATGASLILSAANVIKAGIDIGSAVEGLAHTRTSNAIGELQEILQAVPGVSDFLAHMTPSQDWTDPATGKLIAAGTPLEASQVSSYIDSLGLRPSSAALLKQLSGRVRYDKNGNPTTGYTASLNKLMAGSLEDAEKAVGIMSSAGYRDNLLAWSAEYNRLIGDTNVEILKATQQAKLELARYDAKMHGPEARQSDYETMLAQNDAEQALSQFNEEYYNKLDPDAQASMKNDEARTQVIANIQRKMEARIEAAYLKHFDDAIQSVKDQHLPTEVENQLLSGIYSQRNDYLTELAAKRTEELTKAGKTLGASDWLGAGTDVLGDVLDLVPTKGIGKLFSKPTKRKK